MTAVEWLIEQIKNDQNQKALSAKEWFEIIEQVKEMEKQQIIDAFWEGGENIQQAEIYYNETYGSKGSDEHIVDTNEMIDQVPDVRKMVSSQTEISDEEIQKLGDDYYNKLLQRRESALNYTGQVAGRHPDSFGHSEMLHMVRGFEECAKWYREQLKNKE